MKEKRPHHRHISIMEERKSFFLANQTLEEREKPFLHGFFFSSSSLEVSK